MHLENDCWKALTKGLCFRRAAVNAFAWVKGTCHSLPSLTKTTMASLKMSLAHTLTAKCAWCDTVASQSKLQLQLERQAISLRQLQVGSQHTRRRPHDVRSSFFTAQSRW